MAHSLKKEDLDQLMKNFEDLEKPAPRATYRATFRLSNILEFLSEIMKCKNFTPDDDFTHNIAITFVREDLSNRVLGYFEKPEANLSDFSRKHKGKKFSQVIPIITGCVARLGDNYVLKSYEDIFTDEGKTRIPFVRSGGEGTGLIPPPPRGK